MLYATQIENCKLCVPLSLFPEAATSITLQLKSDASAAAVNVNVSAQSILNTFSASLTCDFSSIAAGQYEYTLGGGEGVVLGCGVLQVLLRVDNPVAYNVNEPIIVYENE